MAPKRTRKYKTKKKTTTKQGKREYQRFYMRDYRKNKTQGFQLLKTQHPNIYEAIFGKKKRRG